MKQSRARFGGHDAARAAVEQPNPQAGFQPAQGLAEAGRADALAARRLPEASGARHRHENRQIGHVIRQSSALSEVASQLGATPMQVALAWLLQRSPNLVLIPGTSSVQHLRENLAAAELRLPEEAVARLDLMDKVAPHA